MCFSDIGLQRVGDATAPAAGFFCGVAGGRFWLVPCSNFFRSCPAPYVASKSHFAMCKCVSTMTFDFLLTQAKLERITTLKAKSLSTASLSLIAFISAISSNASAEDAAFGSAGARAAALAHGHGKGVWQHWCVYMCLIIYIYVNICLPESA